MELKFLKVDEDLAPVGFAPKKAVLQAPLKALEVEEELLPVGFTPPIDQVDAADVDLVAIPELKPTKPDVPGVANGEGNGKGSSTVS